MNTPADSNTRENANTNTDISITANATGFSTKTLNPQILVTLWNVERLGSFSAVARETGWSQPAISQQIRKVERELDAKLVQRTSHGVELTPIGRILARHGQLIDNRVTQAVKDVEEYQRNGSTHIRLVAPPSVCSSFVARVLVHISKTSDIRVSLMQMEPPEAMEALEQGLADCAIIFQYNSLPALAGPDDLEVAPFGVDPLMLLIGANNAIARQYESSHLPVQLVSARGEQWIAGCETCQANLVSLARAAGFTPEITHSTDDFLGHAESGGSRHGRLDHISLSHNRWNPTRFGRTANRRQQRIPHSLFRHKKSGRPTGSGPRQRRNRKGVTPVFGKHLIHRLISVLIRNRGILQQTIVSSILLYRHNQINN